MARVRTELNRKSPAIPHGNVRHEPFERRPDVSCPPPARRRRRPNQRVRCRLPDVQEILEIRDSLEASELPDDDRHRVDVWLRLASKWVVVERLFSVPGAFDTGAILTRLLEHEITAEVVARSHRDRLPQA